MSSRRASLVAVGTAVPAHDIHSAFVDWAQARLGDDRDTKLFARMAKRSGIDHRWSVLPVGKTGGSPVDPGGFYASSPLPSTAPRMVLYAQHAPDLALAAVANLSAQTDIRGITHIVVASCTGFVAPGIDQIIAARLGLAASVERLLIGFMGCYAAIAALRAARHIVRSDAQARVLVVTVELSTLHLQSDVELESLLAMLQFGDGAAAALVVADAQGLGIDSPFAHNLPDSADLIRWVIGDEGFAMHLSGEVPGRIMTALRDPATQAVMTGGVPAQSINAWAVHAGGRSILDAVAAALDLDTAALDPSRTVLQDYGNMSSSTLMFVLARLFDQRPARGVALAFGPGLAAEGFGFGWND
ncbi:MAG: type III polyketide synthase [Sphingomonadaceae bacterium]